MVKTTPFQHFQQEYDGWFVAFPHVLSAELRAIRRMLPESGRALEVGVGSGIFASALNIDIGVDPCREMLAAAKGRGVRGVQGVGEALPFADSSFDSVLLVTVLCFVEEPLLALKEAHRVLTGEGTVVVAFIDRHSPLGKSYCKHQQESRFYRQAQFLSAEEVCTHMREAGFASPSCCQTISIGVSDVGVDEPVLAGSGRGGFVVAAAPVLPSS